MMDRRILLAAAVCAAADAASPDASAALPVTAARLDWRDPARGRTIPVLIRLPAPGRTGEPAPLVLLSHGLGGTREGLAYLGAALADAGYVCVHLQHHGSDAAIWRGGGAAGGGMGSPAMDPTVAVARLGDVVFALDHILSGAEPALRGRVDPARIAVAGHSFGAWTVSHMLGQKLLLGGWGLALPDPRLRAGVALSPVPPLPIPLFGVPAEVAYAGITAPILHVTGTQDTGLGAPEWRARTVGYRTAASPGVLAVLDGAAHASFAGEAEIGGRWNDPAYQPRTARLARRFLDGVLRGDAAAMAALLRGDDLGARDTVEAKGLA